MSLSKAVLAAIAKPEVAANATKQGMLSTRPAPAVFRAYQEAEVKKWAEVVRIANVNRSNPVARIRTTEVS